jgi:hypothetical protein
MDKKFFYKNLMIASMFESVRINEISNFMSLTDNVNTKYKA